jgi:hypothetical protein
VDHRQIEDLLAGNRKDQFNLKGVSAANPYSPALEWIRKNSGTDMTTGLAKLILSMWKEEAQYSLRKCCS